MKYFILLLLILGSVVSQSQSIQRSYPTASQNNQNIPNAWSGGLNSCQLSEIDLNLDGIKDLLFLNEVATASFHLSMEVVLIPSITLTIPIL